MARITEILDTIKSNFANNFVLRSFYGLNANKSFDEQFSPVSLETQYVELSGALTNDFETLVDVRTSEIEAKIAAEYPFSVSWYYARALAFQFGDTLQYNPQTFGFDYEKTDAAKQIIKHVSIRQIESEERVTVLRIYVAKEGKKALSADELKAFTGYLFQIGAAGTHFDYITRDPDKLEINVRIFYDPQVLNSSGERLRDGGNPITEAIHAYLDAIRYGGVFSRTRLVDAIQRADGVADIVLDNVSLNGVLNNSRTFESPSGFYVAETINATYTPAL